MARKSRIDEGVTGAGNIYDFGLEDTEAPGEVEDAAEDVTFPFSEDGDDDGDDGDDEDDDGVL